MEFKKSLIVPSIIFSTALVLASWYYLVWLAPVIAIVICVSVLMLILSLGFIVIMAIIERWGYHKELISEYAANTSQHKAKRAFFEKITERSSEVFEAVLGQIKMGLIHVGDLGTFETKPLSARSSSGQEPLVIYEKEPRPLLDALAGAQRVMVTGGMGSGKTTVLLHLAEQRAHVGSVTILDTHSRPTKWPHHDSLAVVGSGRDYNAVRDELRELVDLMTTRYQEMSDQDLPDRHHPIITLLADEWTMLPDLVPNIKDYSKPLLVESRKASIDFVIAVHDVTVEALGLRGVSGLKQAFDAIVHCNKDANTGQYTTDVQWGWNSKVRETMIPPGPHRPNIIQDAVVNEDDETVIIDLHNYSAVPGLPMVPDEEEAVLSKYYEMINGPDTFSWNQLSISIYGKRGGTYNEKIRLILDQYNIDYQAYM